MKKYRNYIIAGLVFTLVIIVICFIPIRVPKLIPIVENQAAKDFGINAHLENLVLRIGPRLKLKTPIMHLMYEDGQKFAQLDSVKFYIPWSSILKNNPQVTMLEAKNLTVRVNSDDKYLQSLITEIKKKDFAKIPAVKLKGYKISYLNRENNDKYMLSGQELNFDKIVNYKNFNINTKGFLEINNTKYINYDIALLPKINISETESNIDYADLINKIKLLDFHSDIITDIKLYKNNRDEIQASGFLNIDNISVLDKTEKNPKSFVYLMLWGDKASILSNIYTSTNKKVYLEGVINNSKKPVVDLKVKTDEIDLDGLFNKLKLFVNLSRFKNIDTVNGTLNANFTLKGDLNKLKSSGYLTIKNTTIKAGNLKIEKINSDVDFSNNVINITNAVGFINNAPIMLKGQIDKDINLELLMNKVELKRLLPEKYGIKRGMISLVANITGKLDNIVHKESLQIDNFEAECNKNTLSLDSLKIDTNKNNTAYINNVVLKTDKTQNIKIPSLRLSVGQDSITLPETKAFMPNSMLTIKGNIANYSNKDFTFGLNAGGFVNSSDLKLIKANSSRYPVKFAISGTKYIQNINSQVLFEKPEILDEPAILNMASKLSYDKLTEKFNLKIDDISILGFSGKFSDDFKLNLKGQKKIVINGGVEDLKAPVFKNIRVNIPQILNLQFYDTVTQLKGDVFVNGEYLKPEIVGQIFIQNLFNQPTQMSVSNCSVDFNKNTAVINSPLVKVADSSFGINASIFTDISKTLTVKDLNIKSKFLNTDTLLMYKDIPLKQIPIEIQNGKFYSERIIADIYNSAVYFSAFNADMKLSDNILYLKNISSEIFNGKLAGSLDFNLKDESFVSKIMARSVSAAPIFDIISTQKDSMNGTMDFDTSLTGNLATKKSLNGNIRFIVHNGRMSTLGKLEHLIYAQNVIADNMLRTSLSIVTKALTLKDTGLFKYLRGEIAMNNGIADIKTLQSLGPLMALSIKGQYNPENDYGNLMVLGRISDEIMSGLGAFGDFSINKLMIMLTGEDDKYNIVSTDLENLPQLPVKNTKEFRSVINGTISKPSSVKTFNWISYSQKSLKQKDVPTSNVKVPSFVDELPY